MQAHNDVLATLEAKSKQTSIEDLAKRGKKNVRVITGSDIREMVDRAIDSALAASDWIPPERLEEVKAGAQQEFEAIQAQREQERREASERENELAELQRALLEAKERINTYEAESSAAGESAAAFEAAQQRVEELEETNSQLQASRDAFEAQIDALRNESDELRRELAEAGQSDDAEERIAAAEERAANAEAHARELESRCESLHERAVELEEQHRMLENRLAERATLEDRLAESQVAAEACVELERRVKELEHDLALAKQVPAAPAPAPQADASAMLMMKLMEEIQQLKSQQPTAGQPAAPQGGGGGELESKLAGIVGNLDAKLERLGKKMGVSSAVESDIDFNALVNRAMDEEKELESNIDTVEVEKRQGAGIAANLERIRKLKGGG